MSSSDTSKDGKECGPLAAGIGMSYPATLARRTKNNKRGMLRLDLHQSATNAIKLRRLPENDRPGWVGYSFVFKERQQAHRCAM